MSLYVLTLVNRALLSPTEKKISFLLSPQIMAHVFSNKLYSVIFLKYSSSSFSMKNTSRLGFALLCTLNVFSEINSFAGYSIYIIYISGDIEK